MQIEFTGRHITVTEKLRAQAQAGLERIAKVVGDSCTAHVILSEDKFRKIAEVNVLCKLNGNFTASCEAKEMEQALHDALDKVEKQMLKNTKRTTTKRRHPVQDAAGSVRLQTSDEDLKIQPGMVAKKLRGAKSSPQRLSA
jgi:putative sigma-54 modulation protein